MFIFSVSFGCDIVQLVCEYPRGEHDIYSLVDTESLVVDQRAAEEENMRAGEGATRIEGKLSVSQVYFLIKYNI